MADKKDNKPVPHTTPAHTVNPRGAENKEPFDKMTERKENELNDEPGMQQPGTMQPGSTVNQSSVHQPGFTTTSDTPKQPEGFVAFNLDMYQLSEMYANMRDGNYWSAFRIAVDILHSNMSFDPRSVRGTPAQRLAARARVQAPVNKVQVMELKEKLEECCDNLEKHQGTQLKTGSNEAVGASQEKNVNKVNLAGLIALVRMILSLFQHE